MPGLELTRRTGRHHLRHVTEPRELWRGQQHISVALEAGSPGLFRNVAAPLSATPLGEM